MKIIRVLGIGAYCEKGTMDEVRCFLRDILGAKITPELQSLLKFGCRAEDAWLGTKVPFSVQMNESTNDELSVGKHISKYAPRFNMLMLQVESVDEAVAELRAKGVRISDRVQTYGPIHGEVWEAMIHPKNCYGFIFDLLELRGEKPLEGVAEWFWMPDRLC